MLNSAKWDVKTERSLSDIFNAAADAIERHGHCKMLMRNDFGQMCLLGAINFVVNGDALKSIVGEINTVKMLDRLTPLVGGCPVHWNNVKERTQEEVISLLRVAAKKEEGKPLPW